MSSSGGEDFRTMLPFGYVGTSPGSTARVCVSSGSDGHNACNTDKDIHPRRGKVSGPADALSKTSNKHLKLLERERSIRFMQYCSAKNARRACDYCHARRTKCDKTPQACRACISAGISCTTLRASRRRGPRNRVAEMMKRASVPGTSTETCEAVSSFSSISASSSSPPSPRVLPERHSVSPPGSLLSFLPAQEILQPSSPLLQQRLSHGEPAVSTVRSINMTLCAESIFPIYTVHALLDGFFTYLYPLCPFPHEQSFRTAWAGREDVLSEPFLALLASMLGAYLAMFPGQAREQIERSCYLDEKSHLANDVERCRRVCVTARSAGRLETDGWEVHTAATSYYLAVIHLRAEEWRQGSIYLGECFTALGNTWNCRNKHSDDLHQQIASPCAVQQDVVDTASADVRTTFLIATHGHIRDEVGRRIFWAAFANTVAHWQLGIPIAPHIIPPSTLAQPHPPLPTVVDDIYLSPDRVSSQPPEVHSIIETFNITVKLYKSYSAALCSNGQWSSEEKHQCVARQRNVWSKALKENENLGSSLELNEKVMLSQDGATTVQHSTSSMSLGLDDSQGQMIAYGKWRTVTQHRIQLARLLSSYASVRLHILETLTGLVTPRDVRQLAAKHLVEMKQSVHDLSCAKQVNARGFLDGLSGLGEGVMETCANELIAKVRYVASFLMSREAQSAVDGIAEHDNTCLARFLHILVKLEHFRRF